MYVGLGRPLRTLADAPQSLRDARLAIEHGASTGAGLASVDELNLAVTTMAMTDSALVNRRAAALLAPLQPHPTLLETLRVYLDVELDVTTTGRSLNLHPNSVRYRLSRIEALLGVRLTTASAIADLYLALLASNSERNGDDQISKPAVPAR
jgi:DNA-binding PucR family transcriptional regulator